MIIHFKVAGLLMLALALIHLVFPRYFKWKEDLRYLSVINRQMLFVHTFFIALSLALMGLLCLLYPNDLVATDLGRVICFGFAIFWLARLIVQFFVYSSQLWRGKRFETLVHAGFTVLWLYFTLIFFNGFFRLI